MKQVLNENQLREKIASLREKLNAIEEALVDSNGNPVTDGSGQPIATGSDPQPAPAATPAAAAMAAPAAAPAPAPAAEPAAAQPTTGQTSVNAQGQNVTMPDGTNPETGEKTQQAASTTPAAAPKNRDSMTFGQAFADARKAGEKTFTWKGKQYGTQMAAGQGAQKPAPKVGSLPKNQQAALAAGTAPQLVNPDGMAFGGGGLEESQSVGYSQDPSILSIVQLAGIR